MRFKRELFNFNPDTRCYTAEISTLEANGCAVSRNMKEDVVLYNLHPAVNETLTFHYYDRDTDASYEDVYGWRYKNNTGLELLLIND